MRGGSVSVKRGARGMLKYDLTVVLLPTQWDPKALSISLDSVANLIGNGGLQVECLCAEMVPDDVSLGDVHTRTIPDLPKVLRDYLQFENFNYVAEYGSSARGLRRVIRCARGEYVCLLREGDQIGFRLTHSRPIGQDDVTIGVTIVNADALTSHSQLSRSEPNIQTLSSMAALLASYDGALLVRREFLDQMLGRSSFDATRNYPYFLNELLSLSVIFHGGRVGLSDQLAVCPSPMNADVHARALLSASMNRWRTRIYQSASRLEKSSLIVIDFVIDYLLQAIQRVVSGQDLNTIPVDWYFPRKQLFGDRAHRDGDQFRTFIIWAAEHAARFSKSERDSRDLEMTALPLRAYMATPSPETATVSIVSSAFRAENLIFSFLSNLVDQTLFSECELLIVSPEQNTAQSIVTEFFGLLFPNIKAINLETDPGLYECWNIAIRQSIGKYVTNANVDDRRHPEHLEQIVAVMETTKADVGSAAVAITNDLKDIAEFSDDMLDAHAGKELEVWYAGTGGGYLLKTLSDFFLLNADGSIKQCMNFPHSMPVWRRELHEDLGYFDEAENGTYSDFAMWLNAASRGKRFVHLNRTLGLYLVDPKSHNRIHSNQKIWRRIVNRHMPHAAAITLPEHCVTEQKAPTDSPSLARWREGKKLNFGNQFAQNFGRHRSGWSYALSTLVEHHDESAPVYCEAFIEKKFVWGSDYGDAGSTEPRPNTGPWVGFIHVPPSVPTWFQFEQSNMQVFRSSLWQKSVASCRGLFCLTEYHRKYLLDILKPDFPISALYHPTEIPEVRFDFDRYLDNPNKRLVQVGWWLRKLNAISKIDVPDHIPTVLGVSDWSKNLISYAERRYYGLTDPQRSDVMDFLDNDAYDRLLSENLLFIDFYDTSANNAVIECIARSTPIVVCRHPAVEEYLLADYPLFYDTYTDVPRLIKDRGRLVAAVEMLRSDEVTTRITAEHFVKQFRESEVIQNAYAN